MQMKHPGKGGDSKHLRVDFKKRWRAQPDSERIPHLWNRVTAPLWALLIQLELDTGNLLIVSAPAEVEHLGLLCSNCVFPWRNHPGR